VEKVDLENSSVAFFDDPDTVDEPGFYLLEGEPTTSEVKVYDGGSFEVAGEDDEGNAILKTDDRGRPVFATAPSLQDTVTVAHNTNSTPGQRVWPSPDGEGFVDENPQVEAEADNWDVEDGG
jgi:hypothetical protein